MASGLTETISSLHLMVDVEWDLQCDFDCDPPNDPCVETALQRRGFIRANTDATLTVDSSPLPYTAVPEMDFEMIETIKGGTADEPFRLLMPIHVFPFNTMVGNPFPLTRITVWQARMGDPGVPGAWGGSNYSRKMLARGMVGRTTARFNRRPDIVAVECYRIKSQMNSVTLGVTTSQRCYWRFGDTRCKYPLAAATAANALVESVSNQEMIVNIDGSSTIGTGLSQIGGGFAAFQSGFAEHEGLRIFVRQHLRQSGQNYVAANGPVTTGRHKLVLAFQPPVHPNYSWVGRRIDIVGGCTKNKSACKGKWDNECNFGGFGLLVPTFNPVWEVGGGFDG